MNPLVAALLLSVPGASASEFQAWTARAREEADHGRKAVALARAISGWTEADGRPKLGIAENDLAFSLMVLGQYRDSAVHAGNAARLLPDQAGPLSIRGISNLRLHRYEAARQDFEKAARLEPASGDYQGNLCAVYVALKRFQDAAGPCQAAAAKPNAVSLQNAGIFLAASGKPKQALGACEDIARHAQARRMEAGTWEASLELCRGYAYLKSGDPRSAARDLDSVARRVPSIPTTYLFRGDAHAALGDQARARTDYDKAISLDPEHVEAYEARGRLSEKAGRTREALKDYREACKRDWKPACAAERKLKAKLED